MMLDSNFDFSGSFQRQDYSFKTYIPSSRKVEDSQIPGEEDEEMG